MIFDIVGGSYQNDFVNMNPQHTINWQLERELLPGEQNKYKHALVPTPGLTALVNTNGTNARALYTARTKSYTRCFTIYDQTLFEITSDDRLVNLGTLSAITNDATPVLLKSNSNQQLFIGHSSASYSLDLTTNVLSQVTDVHFPNGVTSLTYLAGYTIITSGGAVYYTLGDNTSWVSTNLFTPSAYSAPTLVVDTLNDYLFCFTSESIETYVNDGTPFSKLNGSTVDIGVVNEHTLCKFHGGFIFCGINRFGQFGVYLHDGSACSQISSPGVADRLNEGVTLRFDIWDATSTNWDSMTDTWDAYITSPLETAYAFLQYTKKGHVQYVLTLPALNTSYVYDILAPFKFYNTLQEWTERKSLNPNTSQQQSFRCRYTTNFNGQQLFADTLTGKIFLEDYNNITEDGNTITRVRTSQIFSQENKYISIYSIELDCNTGVGLFATPTSSANIQLEYSKDGGNTYQTAQNISVGNTSDYTTRAILYKLGTARNWAFRFTVTDQANIMIQNAFVHGSIASY